MQAIWKRALLAVVVMTIGLAISGSSVQAEVQSVDAATFDLDNSGGTLTSVTVGGVFLADLIGPTSASTFPNASPPRLWNSVGGTDPVTSDAALSGLIATNGVLNSNAAFHFGRTIGLDERLFFMELDARTGSPVAEVVTFQAIDSTGAQIGDYQFTLPDLGGGVTGGVAGSNSYGPRLLTYTASRSNGADLAGFGIFGVSFTLADLMGTTGDLGTATGFQIVDQAGGLDVDPMVAGIAAVLPADTDFDGMNGTDIADFHILRNNYLTGTTKTQGDANGDMLVNHLDFFLWRTDFLAAGGSMAGISFLVPEPATVWLFGFGGFFLLTSQRRAWPARTKRTKSSGVCARDSSRTG